MVRGERYVVRRRYVGSGTYTPVCDCPRTTYHVQRTLSYSTTLPISRATRLSVGGSSVISPSTPVAIRQRIFSGSEIVAAITARMGAPGCVRLYSSRMITSFSINRFNVVHGAHVE